MFDPFCSSGPFMPHGGCYLWTQSLIALHAISDAFIVLSYYSIPLTLIYFIKKRKDLKFNWMFACFAVFILACGTSHLLEIWNIWHADYWLSGSVKALTALASVPTAILLVRLIPQALALPSPDALRKLNDELETRVQARTAELVQITEKLAAEIAERKQAEAALRESEELFSKAFRMSPDCLVIVRLPDRTVIRANEALCQLWGSTPDKVIGQPTQAYSTWLHEEERPIFMRTLTERGEYLNQEVKLRLADGRLLDFNISCRMITFSGDDCILTVMRDITEKKRSEEEHTKLAQLIEHSRDFIALADLEGKITFMNTAARKMIGVGQTDDVSALQFTDYVPPQWQEFFKKNVVSTALARGLWEGEMQLRHLQTGALIDVFRSTFVIHDTAGQPKFFATVTRDITERKATAQALAESQALYHSLVEQMPAGIFRKDAAGRYVFVNAYFCRVRNTTPEIFLGKLPSELPPSEAPFYTQAEDHHTQIMQTGQSLEVRDEYHRVDGQKLFFHVVKSPVFDADGKITGSQGILFDVTLNKHMELALRDSEERFRSLANSMPQLAWIAQADGSIFWYNERWYEYTGTTLEQMQGWGWQSVHDPEILPAVVTKWRAAIDSGQAFEMEFPLRGADGRFRTFLTRGQPLKNAQGGVVQWFGTNTDVEALKQAAATLRASEEYFRFLNDLALATRPLAAPAQIMAVTARMLGQHLRVSRCAYADVASDGEQFTIVHDYTDGCGSTVGAYQLSLFGERAVATLRSGQTLIIRDVAAELSPENGAEMFRAIGIQAIITCPLVKDGVLRAMMAVHQTTPRAWQASEITIVQEVVERCWATIERRTAEEEIHQLNAELEQRVKERTAQLEAANKELEAFSYSVSHDLRAPLRAVNGFAGIVLAEFGSQLNVDGRRYLERICSGGQRMGELIDDLLAFSRLSRQAMSPETVNMAKLVSAALEELELQRVGRDIQLHIGELPDGQGDATLLKQVWINLLSNAIKYTRGRTPATIEIGCEHQGSDAIYFVRDNGTGFDMQYAHKLFAVFQRLHRADEFEGTGVGLAIVQRIVHRHGGRVWTEAAPGRGATFYFTLNGDKNL